MGHLGITFSSLIFHTLLLMLSKEILIFAEMINFTADTERVDISVKLEIIDIISDILLRYGSLFSPYLKGVYSYDKIFE